MDAPRISGLPPSPRLQGVQHDRRQRQGRSFEQAFHDEQHGDGEQPRAAQAPLPTDLQNQAPDGRKEPRDGDDHVDVLA